MYMKNFKFALHTVAACAIAALAVACSSDDEMTEKQSGVKETITLTAFQPGDEAGTRIGFDSKGSAYWQSADKIGVWSSSDNKFGELSLSSGAGEATATFTGKITDPKGQYAVYPYNENHQLSGSTLTYYLPSSYTYTSVDQTFFPDEKNGNSFCAPMWGKVSDNDNTVTFKHLGGVLCIKVDKMPAASGTVKVIEASNQLCGTFTATLTDTDPEMKTTKATENNSVTFRYSGATADAQGVFYLPVATGNYSLTIIVSGGTKHSATTSTVAITRTRLQIVNVKTSYSEDGSVTINGHKFIDLGLPSGLLWAETNVGATSSTEAGDYYAWGETEKKTNYSWSTYTHATSSSDLKKYTSSDKKTVLENADDAAYSVWGSFCQMPTYSQIKELLDTSNCTWTCDDTNKGFKVASKKNNNSIFVPASGFYDGQNVNNKDKFGYYWSSTLYSDNPGGACDLILNYTSDKLAYTYGKERYCGCSVRPVVEP